MFALSKNLLYENGSLFIDIPATKMCFFFNADELLVAQENNLTQIVIFSRRMYCMWGIAQLHQSSKGILQCRSKSVVLFKQIFHIIPLT